MKKPLAAVVVLIFAMLVAVGCSSSSSQPVGQVSQPGVGQTAPQAQPATYQDIDGAQAKQLIDSDKTVQIIDVREEYEYNEGHIAGSKLIPIGQFVSRMGEIDKTKPVFVYCLSGSRSAQAAQVLVQSGYARVYNLAVPGLQTWTGPLER